MRRSLQGRFPFLAQPGVQFVALSWGQVGLLNTFLLFRTRLARRIRERIFMSPRKLLVLLCLSFALSFAAKSNAQTKLLRFPDVHGDKVVFTYAGDLWLASTSGGLATRLTAHPGIEVFAKFSPDGKWIAFTGQYAGDEQVYVIPVTAGLPT